MRTLVKIVSIVIVILFLIGFFLSVKHEVQIDQMEYKEINSFNSFEDLSVYDLVRLAASTEIIDSIFSNNDTTTALFKTFRKGGASEPFIVLHPEVETRASQDEIDKLKNLIDGNNKSLPIISELASKCTYRETPTSIGSEAQFVLRRIKGEGILCSSKIRKYEWIHRILFKLGIEI